MAGSTRKEPRPSVRTRRSNVIAIRLDAAYFYERGVRFLQQNDLSRALKAFRKTVEYEPENPINHCNLAGVLSELGDFEASNEVLLHVLEDIDPTMAECQFYLANNYANMGQYDMAEEYVLRYLDAQPEGEYAGDAEEMLGVLLDEFGGGQAYERWEQKRLERERLAARRDGRHLLEEGQFEAAVEWLENVIRRDPQNTAAHNNLSLAYYYTGQYEQAVSGAESVLQGQPHNIHALCNLAVFSAQLGPKERLHSCVQRLRKLFPLHYDQAMKVGTTLGLIGEHAAAMDTFVRLASIVEQPDAVLMHSLAAAAANAGRLLLARRWWRVLVQLPDMTDVGTYYLEQAQRAIEQGKRSLRVSYQCDLPLQVQFADMKKRLREGDWKVWQQEPLLRASLYWGLRHGNTETRKAVIRTLTIMGDQDAQKALRLFLKRHDVDPGLTNAALYALQRTGARGRIEVWRDGQLQSMRMSDIPKDVLLSLDPSWADVWLATERHLRTTHRTRWIKQARFIWFAYLERAFLRSDVRMQKREIWVAALMYVTSKDQGEPVRQKDLADAFGISASSLAKAAARLGAGR